MWSPTFDLAIAELVIFVVLFFLCIFVAKRHGRPGYDAWGFLVVFCILRIVAAGLQIGDRDTTSVVAAIVNVAGISGLMLAIAGVNLEASRFEPNHDARVAKLIAGKFHLVVSLGIVLSSVGGSMLATDNKPGEYRTDTTGHALVQAGYAILLAAVLALAGYSVYMTRRARGSRAYGHEGARKLMYSVLVALPFVAVRILYGLVYAVTELQVLSPYVGAFAVKFTLITLVQLLACISLIVGGLMSSNMNKGRGGERGVSVGSFEPEQPGSSQGSNSGMVITEEQKDGMQQIHYSGSRV